MDAKLRCLLQKRLGSIRFCVEGTRKKLSKEEFVSRRGTEKKITSRSGVFGVLGFGFCFLGVMDGREIVMVFLGSWFTGLVSAGWVEGRFEHSLVCPVPDFYT